MGDTKDIRRSTLQNVLSRDFLFAFFALFAFMAAYHSFTPTLPIYLAKMGCREREIGLLVGIVGVASLVSRLAVGGALAKRPEKSVMIVGGLLSALVCFSYTFAYPFWPFFIARFFQGLSFACIDTAVLAIVVRVTPARYRGQAIGYVLLASPLAMAIAATGSVFLSSRFGFRILFLLCAALSAACFIFSSMVTGRKVDEQHVATPPPRSRFLDLNIAVPALVTFLTYFAGGALFAFIPLYGLSRGVTNPGFFFFGISIMLFLGRILGGRILAAYDKENIIRVFLFAFVAGLVILPFSHTVPFFILAGLLWGLGFAFVVPATMAYALEYVGFSSGAAIGTYQMFMDLGLAVGPAVMGMILPLIGYELMFFCLAAICLSNIGYFQFYVRAKRARRASNWIVGLEGQP